MKQQEGNCKSHITKSLLKAQEHCFAMRLSLIHCLQSWLRQEAVIPISCLRHPGTMAQRRCEGKSLLFFLWLDILFLPRTHISIVIVLMTEPMKRDYNSTGITFVCMWTLGVIKLLSWKHWWWVCWCHGWFGWKLNKGGQRSFPNCTNPLYNWVYLCASTHTVYKYEVFILFLCM